MGGRWHTASTAPWREETGSPTALLTFAFCWLRCLSLCYVHYPAITCLDHLLGCQWSLPWLKVYALPNWNSVLPQKYPFSRCASLMEARGLWILSRNHVTSENPWKTIIRLFLCPTPHPIIATPSPLLCWCGALRWCPSKLPD